MQLPSSQNRTFYYLASLPVMSAVYLYAGTISSLDGLSKMLNEYKFFMIEQEACSLLFLSKRLPVYTSFLYSVLE